MLRGQWKGGMAFGSRAVRVLFKNHSFRESRPKQTRTLDLGFRFYDPVFVSKERANDAAFVETHDPPVSALDRLESFRTVPDVKRPLQKRGGCL